VAKSVCTICKRPDKTEIDKAVLSSVPLNEIAAHFGISRFTLGRHRKRHIIELRGKPRNEERGYDTASLINGLLELQEKNEVLLSKCERTSDRKGMASAITQGMRIIESLAWLSGSAKSPRSGDTTEKPGGAEGLHGHREQLPGLIDRARLFDVKRSRSDATLPTLA
jgi:hypothetical protein